MDPISIYGIVLFNFIPTVFWIPYTAQKNTYFRFLNFAGYSGSSICFLPFVTESYSNKHTLGYYQNYYNLYIKKTNNNLYWYSMENANYQFNDNEYTYYYMAIS